MKISFEKIAKSLLEHWVITLLSSGGIVAAFFGWIYRTYLKDWLVSKNSFELYGWVWIAAIMFIALLPFFISWLFTRPKYKNEEDVKNVLSAYLRHCTNGNPTQENTFRFNAVDKLQKLKRGSAKKYFKDVINETNCWSIVNQGDDTIRVKRDSIKNVFGRINKT